MAEDLDFEKFGAKLITKAKPWNPWNGDGHKSDPAHYLQQPGTDFMRPWLCVQDGPAFQWPLGMQGFSDAITASLGIHRYIGDDGGVEIDVLHRGEEHITLSGFFAGDSSAENIVALREVVLYQPAPGGKILYVPEIANNPWRVQVATAQFDRSPDDRGDDCSYSIEFVKMSVVQGMDTGDIVPTPAGSRKVKVNAKHRTLRSLAAWKLNNANKWRILYDIHKNKHWFEKHHISYHKAPTYRLPIGHVIYY